MVKYTRGGNLMVKKVKKYEYEKAETTFNKNDELDMQLYNYLLEKSKVIGKSNYLKQLIYEDKLRSEK
jgi:hypothetical protein